MRAGKVYKEARQMCRSESLLVEGGNGMSPVSQAVRVLQAMSLAWSPSCEAGIEGNANQHSRNSGELTKNNNFSYQSHQSFMTEKEALYQEDRTSFRLLSRQVDTPLR